MKHPADHQRSTKEKVKDGTASAIMRKNQYLWDQNQRLMRENSWLKSEVRTLQEANAHREQAANLESAIATRGQFVYVDTEEGGSCD